MIKKPKLLIKHKDLYQIYVLEKIIDLINEHGIETDEFHDKFLVLLYLNYLLKLHKMPLTISRSEEVIADTYEQTKASISIIKCNTPLQK